jgi:hypothetical protein
MKAIILFLFISLAILKSQVITGNLKDTNNNPIPYANVVLFNSRNGTNANEDGSFKLDITNCSNDSLLISAIGFQNKILHLTNYRPDDNLGTIVLESRSIEINTVTVNAHKINYNKKVALGLQKEGSTFYYTLFGDEICAYIENSRHQRGLMNAIHLHLKKHWWADYTTNLNIKIYQYNQQTDAPGEPLYFNNIIVSPGNKTQDFKIPVKDYNIIIPKEGVCIAVEWINSSQVTKKEYTLGPGFQYTNASTKKLTWKNYRNKKWVNGAFEIDGHVSNALISVDVLFEN